MKECMNKWAETNEVMKRRQVYEKKKKEKVRMMVKD